MELRGSFIEKKILQHNKKQFTSNQSELFSFYNKIKLNAIIIIPTTKPIMDK